MTKAEMNKMIEKGKSLIEKAEQNLKNLAAENGNKLTELKIKKTYTNLDEYHESPEYKDIWAGFDNSSSKRVDQRHEVKFIAGHVDEDGNLWKWYELTDEGISIMKIEKCSACIHNGGFSRVYFIGSKIFIEHTNWAKTTQNRAALNGTGICLTDDM